jgi:AraC family ethanolamine operon transcriptional activator
MNSISFRSALAPRVYKFSDIDGFRSFVRHLDVDFTPLVQKIDAEQVILNLPGCDVNFIKSFPRIMDAQAGADCTVIGFPMDQGIPIRFNGVERALSVIVIGGSRAVYNVVEWVERQYASIVFTPEISDRGWPEAQPNFRLLETSLPAQYRLQGIVREVLASSSSFNSTVEAREAASGMKESILAGIDAAFVDVVATKWSSDANSLRQFKIFQQARDILSANIGQPIYSAELAKQVGVSVRALHDTVLRYRGMSLHRYLRLRRLWLVRRRLREGTHSVKASALAFGFWHFGDFSRSYRTEFGETPSQSLARWRDG